MTTINNAETPMMLSVLNPAEQWQ